MYVCVFFKVNEYDHRRVCYYFITPSECYSDRLYSVAIGVNAVLRLGVGEGIQACEADGLKRPINVCSSCWTLGGTRNGGYRQAGIITTMSTICKDWESS